MDQHMKHQRRMAWWIALGMTGALFVVEALFFNMRFLLSDDLFILRQLMGYDTGTPATFLLFSHGLLVWPIALMSRLFPLVPWYSYTQLALLYLSLLVIAKSLIQCCLRYRHSLWIGILMTLTIFIAFGAEYATVISFTHTATLLSAAAVAQMFSIDYERSRDRDICLGMFGSLSLAVAAYAVRLDLLLPTLAYCGLSFLVLCWRHFGTRKKRIRPIRPMVISLVVVAIVFGTALGIRQLELAFYPDQEYLAFDKALTPVIDYYGLNNLPQSILDEAGWDAATREMTANWVTFDRAITVDALHTITDHLDQEFSVSVLDNLRAAKRLILKRAQSYPHTFRMINLLFITSFGAMVFVLFKSQKRLLYWLALIGLAGGFTFMLLYLAYQGRLPIRVVVVCLLPALVMLFMYLPCFFSKKKLSSLGLVLSSVLILLFSAHSASEGLVQLYHMDKPERTNTAYIQLEQYALEHPDQLFMTDISLADDRRVFPEYDTQTPHNIQLWGSWPMRSKECKEVFARFGIDIWNFDPEVFFRDDVFLVTAAGAPPDYFLNWLEVKTGQPISWKTMDQHLNISMIQFDAVPDT